MRILFLTLVILGAGWNAASAKPMPKGYGYGRASEPSAPILDLRGFLPGAPSPQPANAEPATGPTIVWTPAPILNVPTALLSPEGEGGVVTETASLQKEEAYLIQIGAFAQRSNAEAARERVAPAGQVFVESALVGEASLFRVRLGPWSTRAQAEQARATAIGLGFPSAKLLLP